MTNLPDELRALWNMDCASNTSHTPELVRDIDGVARRFDRMTRLRDLRETIAGLLVAAVFLWLALHDRTPLERAAHGWLSACGIWIILYLRRYARISRNPSPDLALLDYHQQLLHRYDWQIRLLTSAKYWYILPFLAGLVFSAVASFLRTGDMLRLAIMAAAVTAFNVALWWLNR